jgi:hypothetical protein
MSPERMDFATTLRPAFGMIAESWGHTIGSRIEARGDGIVKVYAPPPIYHSSAKTYKNCAYQPIINEFCAYFLLSLAYN